MKSGFYDCSVMHQRLAPKRHRLQHAVFMFYLDLDELPLLDRRLRLFSSGRPNLYAFHEKDHLDFGAGTLRENAVRCMQEAGLLPEGAAHVRLLTHPRMLGYVFNPISVFYFFDEAERPLGALAEVGNTFGEQKPFALAFSPETERFEHRTRKDFYVSPFSDVEDDFAFRVAPPGEEITLQVDTFRGDEKQLVSSLKGRFLEPTNARLLALTARYPFVTLKVIALIHWHALLLWLKGAKFFWKESKPEHQVGVHRPHRSIRPKQDLRNQAVSSSVPRKNPHV